MTFLDCPFLQPCVLVAFIVVGRYSVFIVKLVFRHLNTVKFEWLCFLFKVTYGRKGARVKHFTHAEDQHSQEKQYLLLEKCAVLQGWAPPLCCSPSWLVQDFNIQILSDCLQLQDTHYIVFFSLCNCVASCTVCVQQWTEWTRPERLIALPSLISF